ncbi:MAG: Xaa-Pro aminopeptidase [Ignavibacteriae bacterium]|nr:MAG: Xaa-Pro aminopeptidase [Ignavibacteriota bacterium]
MFNTKTYENRRETLKQEFSKGVLLFLSNNEMPMNFASNTYHYRQDSTFLYYWGLNEPGVAAIIDLEKNEEIIFGDNRPVDDIIWMGHDDTIKNKAEKVGVHKVKSFSKLSNYLDKAKKNKRNIHFLPQYRADNVLFLSKLLNIKHSKINDKVSKKFIKAVVKQRSIKSNEEIVEIEKALDISYEMNTLAMKLTKPGIIEREVFGVVEGIALSKGNGVSFPIIFSVHGETLHNHSHNNVMRAGQIAVLDSGAETTEGYASDITRTFPVNGQFTKKQKDIYNIVLDSQLQAIKMIKPGIKFKDIHLQAARVITSGLKDIGLMKGDVDEAVAAGAHALFFPHGLGHMMGLDVHDMENLGENYVGYNKSIERSNQFGLAYLRLGKKLKEGFVITVEPGCYFIPALIEQWKKEKKHAEFINYSTVKKYNNFGGIRIEDDILLTKNGYKILGKPIPKTVEEVEEACSKK